MEKEGRKEAWEIQKKGEQEVLYLGFRHSFHVGFDLIGILTNGLFLDV
jgi:hypothetical protein